MINGDLIPQDALTKKLLVEILAAMTRHYLQHKKPADKSEGIAASTKAIALTMSETDGDSDKSAKT